MIKIYRETMTHLFLIEFLIFMPMSVLADLSWVSRLLLKTSTRCSFVKTLRASIQALNTRLVYFCRTVILELIIKSDKTFELIQGRGRCCAVHQTHYGRGLASMCDLCLQLCSFNWQRSSDCRSQGEHSVILSMFLI